MSRLILILALISSPLFGHELSRSTARVLNMAYQLAEKENYSAAIEKLEKLKPKRSYDQAIVNRSLGIYYWRNGDNTRAIAGLKAALNKEGLKPQEVRETRHMLADLYLTQAKYNSALQHYYLLLDNINEEQKIAEIWLKIAQAHYQERQWSKSIIAINKHINKGTSSKVSSLVLLLSAQSQLELYADMSKTLTQLIAIEPDNVQWWHNLAHTQLRLDNQRAAMDTLALAKVSDISLSTADIRLLAQLYARHGVPEMAARVLSEVVEVEESKQYLLELAVYWQRAKEWNKAIAVWRSIAKQDAQYYLDLARLLVDRQEYQQALSVLDMAQGKPSDIALLKSKIFYHLMQWEKALDAARVAKTSSPNKRTVAWYDSLSRYVDQYSKQN